MRKLAIHYNSYRVKLKEKLKFQQNASGKDLADVIEWTESVLSRVEALEKGMGDHLLKGRVVGNQRDRKIP